MKKRIALLLATVLTVGTLATACGGNGGNADASKVKVGLGVSTSMSESKNFPDNYGSGVAQADVTMAAVKVDEAGKIIDIVIDCVQVKANLDATGAVTNEDINATFKTKTELGYDYNMKGTSEKIGAIAGGAEWFEQCEYFEQYCLNKTADEIAAIAITDGKATDTAILAGCTMNIDEMQKAVVKACKAATWEGASADDKLTLGVNAKLDAGNTASATAEAAGKSQAYVTIAAVASNAEGKITCAVIDCVQANSTFDNTGKITTDLTAEVKTKYEKKEAYGMKDTSAQIGTIQGGAEWYEQAEFFMSYVNGKTATDVAAIAVTTEGDHAGQPTDSALTAGCTMVVTEMMEAIVTALNAAK